MPSTPDIIDFCVKVADQTTKRHPVIESHYYLCTDGKYRTIHGFHSGVEMAQPEQKKIHFVYWDSATNTTFAMKVYLSSKEALDDQEARIAKNMQEFRETLASEKPIFLQSQLNYWTGVATEHGLPKLS